MDDIPSMDKIIALAEEANISFRETAVTDAKLFRKTRSYEGLVKVMTEVLNKFGLEGMTKEEIELLHYGYTRSIERKKALLKVLDFMEKNPSVESHDIGFINETKVTLTNEIGDLTDRFRAVFKADPVCTEVVTKGKGLRNLETLDNELKIKSKESLVFLFPTPSEMHWDTSSSETDCSSESESDISSDGCEDTLAGFDISAGVLADFTSLSEEERIKKWSAFLSTDQGRKIYSGICSTRNAVREAALSFEISQSQFQNAVKHVTVEEAVKLVKVAVEAKSEVYDDEVKAARETIKAAEKANLTGYDGVPSYFKNIASLEGYADVCKYPSNVAQGKRLLQLFERVKEVTATTGVVKGPSIMDISSDGCEDTLAGFDISAGVLANFTSCSEDEQMKKWFAFLSTDQGRKIYSGICSTRKALQEASASFKFETLSEFQDALNHLPELSDVTNEEAKKLIEAAKEANLAVTDTTSSSRLRAKCDKAVEAANLGHGSLASNDVITSVKDFTARVILQGYRDVEQYPLNVTEGKRLLQLLKRVKEATSKGNQT